MSTVVSRAKLGFYIAAALAAGAVTPVAWSAETQGLEEIIVQARKRSENLQDLSTSVSALSSADLERRFDVDLRDFQNAAPNVVIDDLQQGPGSPAAISIRGIGTTDVEKSFDPTVGVVIDGIFIGANSGAMLKAIDIQSVEILRGPQGTLFGRNSIAGVINMTRSRPTEDFTGKVRLGFGNYSDRQADAYVSGPIIEDKLLFKVGGAKRQHDGYFYNRTKDVDVGEEDYRSANLSLLFRPMDGLEFLYKYDRTWQDQDANTVVNMAQPGQLWCVIGDIELAAENHCAQSTTSPESGDRYTVLQNGAPSSSEFNSEMHILNAGWELNDRYRLDYVFGKFETDEKVYQDWDGTSETLYHTYRPAVYDQQSHELRLTFGGERLNFTLGGYYWDSEYQINLISEIGFAVPGLILSIPQTAAQTTKSTAFFFEGDYKLTDRWSVNLGGRYTKDKKTAGVAGGLGDDPTGTFNNLGNPERKEWTDFSPKASVKFRLDDDLMFYALYSSGFRAGGYSGRPGTIVTATTAYNPETVDNYELGLKSEWLDRRLRVNASVFQMKYNDKQEELSVAVPNPDGSGTGQQTLVFNASKAEITGVEIDWAFNATEGLTLSGSLGFLDAKYDQFLVDQLDSEGEVVTIDYSDLKLRRAPDFTGSLSANYTWDVMNGKAWVQADWHYIDELELTFENSPQSHNDAQSLLDASISYSYENATFSLYGRNLTEEDSWSQAYDVGGSANGLWTYAATRPPRTWGFRMSYDF